jgi:hypothetical protein
LREGRPSAPSPESGEGVSEETLRFEEIQRLRRSDRRGVGGSAEESARQRDQKRHHRPRNGREDGRELHLRRQLFADRCQSDWNTREEEEEKELRQRRDQREFGRFLQATRLHNPVRPVQERFAAELGGHRRVGAPPHRVRIRQLCAAVPQDSRDRVVEDVLHQSEIHRFARGPNEERRRHHGEFSPRLRRFLQGVLRQPQREESQRKVHLQLVRVAEQRQEFRFGEGV